MPNKADLDAAAALGAALVDQVLDNHDLALDVVYSLSIDELRLTLIALAGATATVVREFSGTPNCD